MHSKKTKHTLKVWNSNLQYQIIIEIVDFRIKSLKVTTTMLKACVDLWLHTIFIKPITRIITNNVPDHEVTQTLHAFRIVCNICTVSVVNIKLLRDSFSDTGEAKPYLFRPNFALRIVDIKNILQSCAVNSRQFTVLTMKCYILVCRTSGAKTKIDSPLFKLII